MIVIATDTFVVCTGTSVIVSVKDIYYCDKVIFLLFCVYLYNL